jgi:hypothetical protein
MPDPARGRATGYWATAFYECPPPYRSPGIGIPAFSRGGPGPVSELDRRQYPRPH